MNRNPMMPRPCRFVKAVATALRHRCGVRESDRLLVATSGGADSVALLRALVALADKRSWRLSLAVGHVQHHLRDQAEAEAVFVRELAGELGLPFFRADLDLSSGRPGNPEARARRARYAALASMAHRFNARHLVTAHHGDDQLETLLMRLLRGSSVRGLAGMAWRRTLRLAPTDLKNTSLGYNGPKEPPVSTRGVNPLADSRGPFSEVQVVLIRPMLMVDRAQVYQYLTELGQAWCEDHTNRDVTRVRNRLRHQVLPVLRKIQPDAARRAVSLADHARQVSRLLEARVQLANQHVTHRPGLSLIDRDLARTLPGSGVVLWGLLRELLIQAGVPADGLGNRVIGPIVRAIRDKHGGRRGFDLPGKVRVQVDQSCVNIRAGDQPEPASACQSTRGASPQSISRS